MTKPDQDELIRDPISLRKLFGRYPTGVSIVTAFGSDGEPAGMVIGSLGSVSLDPPLVSFCPAKSSKTWPIMGASGRFCANILGADQADMCQRFFRGGDRFSGFSKYEGFSGPVAAGSLFAMDCSIDAVHEAGDHFIVVGRVETIADLKIGEPLIFCNSTFGFVGTL